VPPDPIPASYSNRHLNKVSPNDLALLSPRLERVQLAVKDRLELPSQPIENAYFFESGLSSVVAIGKGDKRIEVGITGREGMTALMVVHGNDQSPYETFVQIAGEAMRLSADDLRDAMATSPTLRNVLLHYAQAFLIQTAHTAVANGHAKLEERLARWLLMAHDRIDGDELPLRHEFLSLMLGVRRAGVTVALHELEGQGLIRANRARILVVDRQGLEQVAEGIYGVPEAEYERLMAQ
jgi:CRP-like cAMP-binding protein